MQEAAAGATHRASARFEALRLLLDVLLVLQVLPADPEGAGSAVFGLPEQLRCRHGAMHRL
jgi:hypothetical protein